MKYFQYSSVKLSWAGLSGSHCTLWGSFMMSVLYRLGYRSTLLLYSATYVMYSSAIKACVCALLGWLSWSWVRWLMHPANGIEMVIRPN